jgi:hypothetical protein
MKRLLRIIIFLLWVPLELTAQLVDFYEAITAVETPAGVVLNWTLREGNTCNGQLIQRSIDSLVYEDIGEITGICGSLLESKPYTYIDENPVYNQTVYYRIFAGGQGYSYSIATFFIEVEYGDFLVMQDLQSKTIHIVFKNIASNQYQLTVSDIHGRVYTSIEVANAESQLTVHESHSGFLLLTLTNLSNGTALTKKVSVF